MAEGGFMGDMFGGLDMKELLIATAFSQSPELQPLVPHIMQGYRQAKQAKVGEQFAQGLLEAQQLAAKGDFTGANAAISNLTGVAARAGQTGSLTQMGQFVMKQQREQTQAGEMGRSFQQTFGVSDDVASVMPHISSRDRLRLARGERASFEGTSVIFDPITQKIVSTEALPQRVDAKQLSSYGESIMERLGMTTAEFANAYNAALDSGDMAQVQLFRSFAQGLPESQEVFKREQAVLTRKATGQVDVGIAAQKAQVTGAISNQYALDLARQMTPIEVAKAEQKSFAAAVGAAQGEMATQLPAGTAEKLGVPFGTTGQQASGRIFMSATDKKNMMQFSNARVIIDQVDDLSQKVNTRAASGGIGRLQQFASTQWGTLTQTDSDAALLATKVGQMAMIARSMGESGHLAEGDVKRAMILMPDGSDTAEVAMRKIQELNHFFDEAESLWASSLTFQPTKDHPTPYSKLKAEREAAGKPYLGVQGGGTLFGAPGKAAIEKSGTTLIDQPGLRMRRRD